MLIWVKRKHSAAVDLKPSQNIAKPLIEPKNMSSTDKTCFKQSRLAELNRK
jgi:hypothetical protein